MSFNSSKAELNVNSVLDKDAKDIKDIKNNIEIKYPFYFWIILFICILLFVLSILWMIKSITNNALNKKYAEKNKTPEEIAEESLAKLSEIKLDSKENIKQYYTLLTEILKRYIEARYSVETMDQTTSELYKLLRDKDRAVFKFIDVFLVFLSSFSSSSLPSNLSLSLIISPSFSPIILVA